MRRKHINITNVLLTTGLIITLAVGSLIGSSRQAQAVTEPPVLPLRTSGNTIVDANGTGVTLKGVNWFGFETANHAPHGLWTRDYKDMLAQIKSLGFNTIRMPFSLQALRSTTTSGIDYGGGRNSALNGKTPQQVMDIIIDEAATQNLMIILDNHSQADDGFMYDLWYGQNGFTETDWLTTWSNLAQRYQTKTNVIGADLKNEPHGRATWGTGSPTDWRLAAEKGGNAVLAKAPNWLILVEGIEGNVTGGQLDRHWWGGNLEGVANNPVRLNVNNRIVYSPHEYGPSVYTQPWFSDPNMAAVLADRWTKGFGYIHDNNIAPILVGEFGAKNVDLDTTEGKWIRQFANYMSGKGIHWTFWSWNPNSGDTGGILTDDWKTVHTAKMDLLRSLQNRETIPYGTTTTPSPSPTPTASVTPTPTPTPSSTPTASPSPTATPSSTPTASATPTSNVSNVSSTVAIDSNWGTGYCAKFTVNNGRNERINVTKMEFNLATNSTISSNWNGTFARNGTKITITAPAWAGVNAGATYQDTGFCVNGTGIGTNANTTWQSSGGIPTATPTPTPTSTPTPTPTPTSIPTSTGLTISFTADSTWQTGYCRTTTIRNTTTNTINNWKLTFNLPTNTTITSTWSGTTTRNGTTITVTPPAWAAKINPGQSSTSFGFCVNGTNQPTNATVTKTA